MGGLFSSAPSIAAPRFAPDLSAANVSVSELTKQLAAAQSNSAAAINSSVAATKSYLVGWYTPIIYLLTLVAIVCVAIALYDTFAPCNLPNIFFEKSRCDAPADSTPTSDVLVIDYAHYGKDNTSSFVDVTNAVSKMIVNKVLLPSFSVSPQSLGIPDPYPNVTKTLYMSYHIGSAAAKNIAVTDGSSVPILPKTESFTLQKSPPPLLSGVYNSVFGSGSGNLAPTFHDATSMVSIAGNRAPLSSQSEGGYGMQWWMYIKDWNYGYGKEKAIVKRPDTTSGSILNPSISLSPTDNSMKISVSIFPSSEGTSKIQPAPAGHSGSTDDVFVCEVPNIPLQTWFAVSVTVFGRNLDVYIDGKLVKSCFLTGIPKPAVGDIQLTPDGGFSGNICDFYHYPKMLLPSDAVSFYSAGTSCKNKTGTSSSAAATGYAVKFGIYDALGKEVQEYSF
jgi:hypothetical protein